MANNEMLIIKKGYDFSKWLLHFISNENQKLLAKETDFLICSDENKNLSFRRNLF